MFYMKQQYLDKNDAAMVLGGPIIGTAVASREERKAAERDMARARKAQDRIRQIKEARERRRAIREARMQRAKVEQGAVASGAQGSSSVTTGVGSITSQLGANLSFLDQVGALQQQTSIFQSAAAKHQSRAQDFQEFGQLVRTGVSVASGGGA